MKIKNVCHLYLVRSIKAAVTNYGCLISTFAKFLKFYAFSPDVALLGST